MRTKVEHTLEERGKAYKWGLCAHCEDKNGRRVSPREAPMRGFQIRAESGIRDLESSMRGGYLLQI